MKVLVTGRTGQVATSLAEAAAQWPDIGLVAVGRPQFDLADSATILGSITEVRPDVVVSAAAYTAVDKAEDEPELVYAINAQGPAAVAAAARALGVPIIHLSTDYVFSGDGGEPYTETCATGPRTVYGQSKLAGEKAVARANPRHIILRTSWVYSPFGTNFVKTMLALAPTRDRVSVVCDQWGNPTSALDVARAILTIARQAREAPPGIYHYAGAGETNWAGFARHVFDASKANGGPFAEVIDIASTDYPAKARRPRNSRLSCAKAQTTFKLTTADWRASTETVVRRLLTAQAG
ncbi:MULTISPECIES: dTDP-4-dehydrorhamnose reductase [Phyllobacteriaceae]|uniref:dTDP-4-dehydrorhamnose reductase n=1 Tax=Mesorhizobium hungaricum TaxID=1566387 RepID=A0A1C2DW16_9HYPH|nr:MULTISPECIES: dTDP-4-dehydrorhamnose reductase [Mesorhizobium]MBN9234016.1 dTDP-4-dehydrorhamnose reductase [Mesorhizobium sp.]OCX18826.1 dTDP-4-dehydrorhamnose reductase [Mesorhizobium hungaricum]